MTLSLYRSDVTPKLFRGDGNAGPRKRRDFADLELGEQVFLLILSEMSNCWVRSIREDRSSACYKTHRVHECLRDLDPDLTGQEFDDWFHGLVDDGYLVNSAYGIWVALTQKGAKAVEHLDSDESRWALVKKFLKQRERGVVLPTCQARPVGETPRWTGEVWWGIDVSGSRDHTGRHASEAFSDCELLVLAEQEREDNFFVPWDGGWREIGCLAASAADLYVCEALAFWTGNDPKRIDQMFRQSGLFRPKWDESQGSVTCGERTTVLTYGDRTIADAIENADEVWDPRFMPARVIRALEGG